MTQNVTCPLHFAFAWLYRLFEAVGIICAKLMYRERKTFVQSTGRSPSAYRRAMESAIGWDGFGLDLEGTRHAIAEHREVAHRSTPPPTLGDLAISIPPQARVSAAVL